MITSNPHTFWHCSKEILENIIDVYTKNPKYWVYMIVIIAFGRISIFGCQRSNWFHQKITNFQS